MSIVGVIALAACVAALLVVDIGGFISLMRGCGRRWHR